MRNLCLGLSLVAMAVLAACGGDNGSSAGDIGESSSSSEIGIIESCASGEAPSSSSEKAESNTSEDSSSSESGDSSSSSSEDTGSSESGDSSSGSSEESSSSEFGDLSSSSSEDDGSSESGDLSSSSSEESSSSESEESSSSSEVESSSSISSSSVNDESVYDATANTLTDLRDDQVYRTTTIEINDAEHGISYSGVWMAENLNIETENSWCGGGYEETEGDCSVYGRLYTWATAVAKSEDECGEGKGCGLGTGDIRGVCPKGWHLPSHREWIDLITAVGGFKTAGKVLKSGTGWNSYSGIENNDTYLFSALPAGNRRSYGYYLNEGSYAYFWSSAELEDNRIAYYIGLYYNGDNANLNSDKKGFGFSVRCLKD